MTKNPKFFCENCNAEVRHDAMICPHCGKFFSSVRCPSCGFTGTHKEFKNGCPQCGYAVGSGKASARSGTVNTIKKNKKEAVGYGGKEVNVRTDVDPLPLWIYGLVLLLGAVLTALFFLFLY